MVSLGFWPRWVQQFLVSGVLFKLDKTSGKIHMLSTIFNFLPWGCSAKTNKAQCVRSGLSTKRIRVGCRSRAFSVLVEMVGGSPQDRVVTIASIIKYLVCARH